MLRDARDNTVTNATPAALEAYERALRAFQTYRGDPLAPLDEAIALAPGFAGAHAAKALLMATVFERRFMHAASAALEAGRDAFAYATPREQGLVAAARQLIAGDWHGGTRTLDEVLVEHPREILALQVAHVMDFFRGDALNLRNRVSRVLPAWGPAVPGFAYVLGMHAFGYEECNQYLEAEHAGRRSVELSGDDSWAVHAVGHVLEMQGRISEGLQWYSATRQVWDGKDNGFAYHNAWHVALYHLDRGETAPALAIYDARFAAGTETALARVDATALLWRLKLEGVDVAARFAAVADAWEQTLGEEGGFYAFNDFHAALAFAAAGRRDAVLRLREAMGRAAALPGANAEMIRLVGREACEAALDYCEGRYLEAAGRLAAVRDGANRFGGSHAQRDLLTLTLVDAAARAGQPQRARHYLAERLVHKPAGAWGRRIAARIGEPALRRAA